MEGREAENIDCVVLDRIRSQVGPPSAVYKTVRELVSAYERLCYKIDDLHLIRIVCRIDTSDAKLFTRRRRGPSSGLIEPLFFGRIID